MRPSRSAPTPSGPRRATAALVVCGAAVVAGLGCGNGSIGDPPSTPIKNELGHGQCPSDPSGMSCHLCDIVLPATWENLKNSNSVNCTEPPDTAVIVSGVTVLAIDTFDETMDGKSANSIYVEDTSCGGKPYSGIQVFNAGFSPPDLRLAAGDVVDMNGNYEEFIGPSVGYFGDCQTLPEFTGTLLFRFDSVGLPTPVEVTIPDLVGYDNARPYLGMLVTLKNVTLEPGATDSSNRYTSNIDVPGGVLATEQPEVDNELFDMAKEYPITAQTTFASITGIVTYFYKFHISPRSPADFVKETPDGGTTPDGGM